THHSLARQRFDGHEHVGSAATLVFAVVLGDPAGLGRQRLTHLTDQLFTALVHAHHRLLPIIGPVIHIQHVVHGRDKVSRRSFWQTPTFLQPRLKFVFLSVRRPVSWDNDSTYPRPTMRSPNNRNVQRDRPAGASRTSRRSNALPFCRPSSFHR